MTFCQVLSGESKREMTLLYKQISNVYITYDK